MDEQPFENITVTAQVGPSHAAGVIRVRERAFEILAAATRVADRAADGCVDGWRTPRPGPPVYSANTVDPGPAPRGRCECRSSRKYMPGARLGRLIRAA